MKIKKEIYFLYFFFLEQELSNCTLILPNLKTTTFIACHEMYGTIFQMITIIISLTNTQPLCFCQISCYLPRFATFSSYVWSVGTSQFLTDHLLNRTTVDSGVSYLTLRLNSFIFWYSHRKFFHVWVFNIKRRLIPE